MKIDYLSDKIVVYLYQYHLSILDDKVLYQEIKKIFIQLIKNNSLNLQGFNLVHLYHNQTYGCILEIDNILNDLVYDIVDIKLVVHKNYDFYLELDDYLLDEEVNDIIILNDKYYINIDKLNNWFKYIEYGKVVYHLDFH